LKKLSSKRIALMMERNNIIEYLTNKPDALLGIIEEILKSYYEINNNLSITESKK